MATRPSISLSLGLAIAALVLAPAAGSATSVAAAPREKPLDQKFKIENKSSEPITVRVLHSDGTLQKQETIKPGKNHLFTFSWCYECCGHDKQRKFEVKTGSTLRATGDLAMSTKVKELNSCAQKSELTVEDESATDALAFSKAYTDWGLTAILTVKNSST